MTSDNVMLSCFYVFSFGGGPAVNHLYMCAICQVEIEALAKRRKTEIDTFIKVNTCTPKAFVQFGKSTLCLVVEPVSPFVSRLQLNKEFQAEEAPTVILCISMQWFREWESFVKGKDNGMAPWREALELHIQVYPSLFKDTFPLSEPPGPIDNSKIGVMKGGHVQLKQGKPLLCQKGTQGEMKKRGVVRIFFAVFFHFRCRLRTDFRGDVAVLVGHIWRRS